MSADRKSFIDFAALAIVNGHVASGREIMFDQAYAHAEGMWNARQQFFDPSSVETVTTAESCYDKADLVMLRTCLRQIGNIIEASHASSMRRDLDAIDAIVKGALA